MARLTVSLSRPQIKEVSDESASSETIDIANAVFHMPLPWYSA